MRAISFFNCKKFFSFIFRACLIFGIPSVSVLMTGCTRNVSKIAPVDTVLRNQARSIAGQLEWAEELDSAGLPQKNIQNNSLPLPDALPAINCPAPVFPSLNDFAVLDTRSLDPAAYQALTAFFAQAALKQIEKRKINADFLDDRFVFLPFLLENSFKNIHEVKKIYYAKPSSIEDTLQIPVRLQGENVHTDLQVFMHPKGRSWVIEQIYFGDQTNE